MKNFGNKSFWTKIIRLKIFLGPKKFQAQKDFFCQNQIQIRLTQGIWLITPLGIKLYWVQKNL